MGAVLLNRYENVPPSLRSREIALVGNGMYFGDADGVPQELTAAAITRAILIEKIGYEPADADALADVAESGQYADLTGKPDLSVFDEVESYASQAQFPPNGDDGILLYLAADTGLMYRHDGSTYVEVTGKAPIWGEIAGSIDDQTDLRQALASKLEEVPAKYLTQTQGDERYLQSLPDHSHTAQSVEYGSGTVADRLASLGEGVWSDAELRTFIGAFIVAGENIDITPNDAGTAITIKATVSSSGTGGLTGEDVREIAANAFVGANGITITEDDSADTITLSFDVSKSSLSGRLNNIESTLGDKADDNDLASVAKSGQYGDLIGRPDLSAFDEVEAYGSQSDFPSGGDADVLLYIASDTGAVYRYDGSTYVEVSGKAPIWGEITGSLTDQTDLRDWLDGKADKSDTRDDAGIRDLLAATFEGGASINVTRNGDTITIAFTGEAGGGLDAQGVRDTVEAYLSGEGRIKLQGKNSGRGLGISVDDPEISGVTDLQSALDGKADTSSVPNDRDIRNVVGEQIRGGNNVRVEWQQGGSTLTINFAGEAGGSPGPGIDLDAIMADAPTGLYMLDDGGGTTAADASGNGRDGTYEGAVEHGAAPVAAGTSASIRLPGTADNSPRVLLGSGNDFCGNQNGNTIESWFVADDVQRAQVIAEAGAENNGLSLQIADGLLHAVTSEAPNVISVPIEAGVAYHAAAVWKSGDHITVYLQGEEVETVAPGSSSSLDAGGDPAAIGAVGGLMRKHDGSGEAADAELGLGGRIGPVVFYDKPLSSERILAHVAPAYDAEAVRDTVEEYLSTTGRLKVQRKNSGSTLEFSLENPAISQVSGLSDALNGLSQSQQNHENDTDNPHGVSLDIEDITYIDPSASGRSGPLDEVLTRLFDEKRGTNQIYSLPLTTIPCSATPGPNDGEITIQWDQPEYGEADWFAVLRRRSDPRGAPGSNINGTPRMNFVAEVRGSRTEYVDTPFTDDETYYYRVVAIGGPVASATPQ